jgi:uncharacterized membrane protein (UPF0127 family)
MGVAALATVALLAAACSTDPDGGSASTTLGAVAPPESTVPPQLEGFGTDVVDLDGDAWTVAVADTPALRSQGLMGVTNLGPLEGMLFVFAEDTTANFHMEDTLIPLDIAFFTEDGLLVSTTRMVPCSEDPCPTYAAAGPYRYALEAPAGELSALDSEATLVVSAG